MPDHTEIGYLSTSTPQAMTPATPTVTTASPSARRPRSRPPRHLQSGGEFAGSRHRPQVGGAARTATLRAPRRRRPPLASPSSLGDTASTKGSPGPAIGSLTFVHHGTAQAEKLVLCAPSRPSTLQATPAEVRAARRDRLMSYASPPPAPHGHNVSPLSAVRRLSIASFAMPAVVVDALVAARRVA